jgi:uncharacterized protein (DUF433 family)
MANIKWFELRFVLIYFLSINKNEIKMENLKNRITINPEQCGGRPCIRGMRIRVSDILDLFAQGLTTEQILEELPDLENEDLLASLQYASHKINHAVIAV